MAASQENATGMCVLPARAQDEYLEVGFVHKSPQSCVYAKPFTKENGLPHVGN